MKKGKRSRKERIDRWLYYIAVTSFLLPVLFLIVRMLIGHVPQNEAGYHSDADYVLMIVQCLLGLLVINIPVMLARQFSFQLPLTLYGMYIVFLYCAIFLGEVRSFYYIIPYWDSILHAFSSLMLGFLGYMAIAILVRDEHVVLQLSPLFMAIFAFCFAFSIGAVWEIYEFLCDGMLGLNMQKFMLADGTVLQGHAALMDTMKDIMIDAGGALSAALIGHSALRSDQKWVYPLLYGKEIQG